MCVDVCVCVCVYECKSHNLIYFYACTCDRNVIYVLFFIAGEKHVPWGGITKKSSRYGALLAVNWLILIFTRRNVHVGVRFACEIHDNP